MKHLLMSMRTLWSSKTIQKQYFNIVRAVERRKHRFMNVFHSKVLTPQVYCKAVDCVRAFSMAGIYTGETLGLRIFTTSVKSMGPWRVEAARDIPPLDR